MIKTSKLMKRVWIVTVSVIAITLMSVAVSFATEAQETDLYNTQTQEQAAVAEETVVAEEAAVAEEATMVDNAAPLHVDLNVSDANIPLICQHRVVSDGKNVKDELIEINPSEGITFEHPLVTKSTALNVKNDIEVISIEAIFNKNDQNVELFEISYLRNNQFFGIAFDEVVYTPEDSTISFSFKQMTKFTFSVYLMDEEYKSVGPGIEVPYYTADGSFYTTALTDEDGEAIFNLDKEHALGYVYNYNASKNLTYFGATMGYTVIKNEKSEFVARCGSDCRLSEPSVLLLGNEHHSNFIYNFLIGSNGVKMLDYYFSVKELVVSFESIMPVAFNTNDDLDTFKLNVEADGTLALDTTDLLPPDEMFFGINFKPIAESGSVFDNWSVMGSTYFPNSKITIDTSDFKKGDVVDIYANYKLVEASEIAQTSDATPLAAGVVAAFAVIAGLSLLALRKQH